MKYSVIAKTNLGEITREKSGLSKKEVSATAKAFIDAGEKNVYVEWFRKNDGQIGYLNPDGNHEITGKNWVE